MQPAKLSPKQFNLPPRTVLEQVDDHTIAIVMNRKSRIIMADGKKIVEKATKIKEAAPSTSVLLKTTAPVCSKTKAFLLAAGVDFTNN
ncbi:MAG: hypothetical protein ACWGOX_11625 [Desulforhopalus sp.]